MPIIFLALISIVAQYKMHKIDKGRFLRQALLWLIIMVILIGSFPTYNYAIGRPLLDSSELSAFDIAEITAIIYLVYAMNGQRRRVEQSEKTIRDLHAELSIRLSETKQ